VSHFAAYRKKLSLCPVPYLGHLVTGYVLEQAVQDDYLYKLGTRYFAYHLVIAKTTLAIEDSGPSTSPSKCLWTTTERIALGMPERTLVNIDPYSGFSTALLLLINDIVDVRRRRICSPGIDEVVLFSELTRLKRSVSVLDQKLPAWVEKTDPDYKLYLQQTAEANRLGARSYSLP
jgi:hypothetical protein